MLVKPEVRGGAGQTGNRTPNTYSHPLFRGPIFSAIIPGIQDGRISLAGGAW